MKSFGCVVILIVFAFSCTKSEDLNTSAPIVRYSDKDGIDYVYGTESIPEIHISVLESEWNRLLDSFDKDVNTEDYIYCDTRYICDNDTVDIDFSGLRLRGNSSRRRPEGEWGEHHNANDAEWHHAHYNLNLHKYKKNNSHTIHGMKKVILKYFKDDPTYVREAFCFDLFRRYGVWTALNDKYCRLWIRVSGDEKETYMGIYQLMEPVDEHYLDVRKEEFEKLGGDDTGNLWKCQWASTLRKIDDDFSDGEDTKNHPYTLKTNLESFESAKSQIQEFIRKLNTLQGEEFRAWFSSICDVELLIRTISVSVAVGSWDDYWCNHNNSYMYFDSTDPQEYHFYYIPFDFDYTLGTSGDTYFQKDAALKDPLNWGTCTNPLFFKIFQFEDYRNYYIQCLKELCDMNEPTINYNFSVPRILKWQEMIAPFVPNDTGEDCEIIDKPAQWGMTPFYRLTDTDPKVNFFRVKTSVINKLQETSNEH